MRTSNGGIDMSQTEYMRRNWSERLLPWNKQTCSFQVMVNYPRVPLALQVSSARAAVNIRR